MQFFNTENTGASNFTVLIVEDDLPFAIELDMLVQELGYNVKGRIDNSAEALEAILVDPPDLVLMDINIKGRQSGIEVAEQIKDKEVPILFISNIEDQALYDRARATNFVGYLVKPVSKYSIRTAIELVLKNITGNQTVQAPKGEAYANKKFLFFKKKGVFYKILIADILYIQADGDLSITVTKQQQFSSFLSLKALLKLLAPFDVIQVHRSYLVNMLNATSVDVENQYVQFNGIKVPFSRRMKKDLLSRLSAILL